MTIEQYNSNTSVRDSSDPLLQTFPVDVEHTGIRITLPVIMIAGGIALYIVVSTQLLAAAPDLGAGAIGRQLITALEFQMPDLVFEPVNAPLLWYASGFIALMAGLIGALLLGAIADRLLK